MKDIFNKFQSLNQSISLEEERQHCFEYVYLTNKLEGNQLSLVQTTQLLDTETISGENIRTRDILEQKGMFKALNRMLLAVRKNEDLSVDLIKELNGLVLSSLWKDDNYYNDAKSKGQYLNSLKISSNIISISKGGIELERIEPLSNPENAEKNLYELIDKVNSSNIDTVEKATNLAKLIWLHQPFVDGNKRIARLLINFITMKAGYPLFTYSNSANGNYNSLLVIEYMEEKDGLLLNYIKDKLKDQMQKHINRSKNISKPKKGFSFIF